MSCSSSARTTLRQSFWPALTPNAKRELTSESCNKSTAPLFFFVFASCGQGSKGPFVQGALLAPTGQTLQSCQSTPSVHERTASWASHRCGGPRHASRNCRCDALEPSGSFQKTREDKFRCMKRNKQAQANTKAYLICTSKLPRQDPDQQNACMPHS